MSGGWGGAWRLLSVAVVGVTAVVGTSGLTPAGATTSPSGEPTQVLERDMRGEQAIRALGDRLPAVAAQNDHTPAEFRAALRTEEMLWVGRTGQLLFVDDFETDGHDHADESDATVTEATEPLADTFSLHSRPGATRVILLDFDGHDASGTAWDGAGTTTIAAPYDTDGSPGTFSDTERTVIQSVWARVAEDFAAFDVDVTTQDPGKAAIRRDSTSDSHYGTRLVVTPSETYTCTCGGVAYVGVFDNVGDSHDHYQPAWVFTAGVGHGAKNIAEAASHEIGHNLGLHHDGTATTGYYEGHGDWAPIMGVGYYRPITQWSRGEYDGATSGAQKDQDDFAVMRSNGAPFTVDDHGDTPAAATALGTAPLTAIISTAVDVDVFSISSPAAGVATISARPAAASPNLDIGLRLVDAAGTTIASADPLSSASSGNDTSVGLDADIVATVGAGTYYLVVDGVGFGDPRSTGYSDYGSVGRYTVSAIVDGDGAEDPPPTAEPPSAPTEIAVNAEGPTVTVSWKDNSGTETGFEIVRESRHKNGSWRGATTLVAGPDTTQLADDPGTGTFRYRVRAVNDAGASAYTAWAEIVVSGTSGDGGGTKGGGKPTRGG